MQQIVCTVSADVTIKSHASDTSQVIIVIGGTNYTVSGNDLLIATHDCMNTGE